MLSKDAFVDFILKGAAKTLVVGARPTHSALPDGFEEFDFGSGEQASTDDTTFARRLLEAADFGLPELVARDSVIRSTDAVARYLPDRVAFWPKTPSRPYQTLLFESSVTSDELLKIPAFRRTALHHLNDAEAALARLASEALEGFQRGGETVTADVRKGRKEETLCVVSIVDTRDSESVRLVCFGTENASYGGLETFQINEGTRFWDAQLAREHLGLLYERQFRKLGAKEWQEAFTTTEERTQAEKLLKVCTRKTPKVADIQEAVLDLLDSIAKGFGLKKKPNTERRLQAFELPADHDIGIDSEERAGNFDGYNPFGGVTLRDERSRLLGYIVYPLKGKGDAARLREHLEANNRFHNVLVVYPDQDQASLELWQGRDQLRGKLRLGQEYKDAADVVNLLSRFFVVSKARVTNPSDLAQELAYRARYLRGLAVVELKEEKAKGPIRNLYNAFKEALVHDQSEEDFADAFAQTITYGLLTARWLGSDKLAAAGDRLTRQTALKHLAAANPFLNDLFKSVLSVRLDEQRGRLLWLVDDIADLLDRIDVQFVFGAGDVGADTATDPVIHFYEPFLAAYDREMKNKRGVFFTPRPVVSYIVRSIHNLLQEEFGLADGLASTATWGEMAKLRGLKIPEGAKADDPFVCILDPAVGTGTFVFECIETIERTMKDRWCRDLQTSDWAEPEVIRKWNEYVPKYLLPRLYGYELMMAPYAVAHLKLAFKLRQTGYVSGEADRIHVYLTNSLEPASDAGQQSIAGIFAALAHEASAVSAIKRQKRFTVVIGNPPYSNFGQLNRIPFVLTLLEDYKRGLNERKLNLDDDFIKFIRFAQHIITTSGVGIAGMITNHVYIDGLTHRRMRESLLDAFQRIDVLDLHGSVQKKERATEGGPEENVFDIKQGVAVVLMVRSPVAQRRMGVGDLFGTRQQKYAALAGLTATSASRLSPEPRAPNFFFRSEVSPLGDEYRAWWSMPTIMPFYNSGLQTKRDDLTIQHRREDLEQVLADFRAHDSEWLRREYELGADGRDWTVALARKDVRGKGKVIRLQYRPFDYRFTFYTGNSKGFLAYPRRDISDLILAGSVALVTMRQLSGVPDQCEVFVTKVPMTDRSLASTLGTPYLFPLVGTAKAEGLPLEDADPMNFSAPFLAAIKAAIGNGLRQEPEAILGYLYAVLHSPLYRQRYAEFIKSDFPRIPIPGNRELFRDLARLGSELISLHLMESSKLERPITTYTGPKMPHVGRVSWSDDTVWLDTDPKKGNGRKPVGTTGFRGVPERVWTFRVGGYQVCEKWLKDRKGRTLSKDDIVHYQKIVVALNETIRVMKIVDQVVDRHGGWPGAFVASAIGGKR